MTLLQVSPRTSSSAPTRVLLPPAAVGVFGFLLGFAFSWVPSLWYDEAATVSASTRSIPQLFVMLGHVDLVHGLYYLGMHFWFDLVGYSPLTLRLPSAIAVGVTAGLLVVVVRRIGSNRLAVITGILFCLLPRVTWAATEGRSYAITAALATLLTLAFLSARDRPSRTRWLLYSALAIVSIALFLYLALIVIAHGVTLLVQRRRITGWLVAALIAGAVAAPFAILASRQAGQVSWIQPLNFITIYQVLVDQFFVDNWWFAPVGVALAVIGIVVLRRRKSRELLAVVVPWFALPTVALLLITLVATPAYTPRYVTMSTPALAILMAVAVESLSRRWQTISVIALCAALAVPGYVLQRSPEGKSGSAWAEVAAAVSAQRALEPAGTHGAILWSALKKHPDATTRMIQTAYPAAFTGLTDVTLKTPAAESGGLWETTHPLDLVMNRLDGASELWLVRSTGKFWSRSTIEAITDEGFVRTRTWLFHGTTVVLYTR